MRGGWRPVLLLVIAVSADAQIVNAVRSAVAGGDVAFADRLVGVYQKSHGVTPDLIFAESWIARGLLDKGQPEAADQRAVQTRTWALGELGHRKIDAEPELPLALSAAIEVQALAMVKRGARSEAVLFLQSEAQRWRGSSMEARIKKNLNLLTLEGRPAPPIQITHWTGDVKPQSLAVLRGHPVLLFFWAHWCADCKADVPVIQQILAAYGPKGLKIIGPTMHYGFIGGGEEASVDREDAWIEEIRRKYYARIGPMAVPVSETTLNAYGVSTTPTLVLIDQAGIVRLYNPGPMNYAELSARVEKVMTAISR